MRDKSGNLSRIVLISFMKLFNAGWGFYRR